MTDTEALIATALAAADLFREGDTPDQHEIRELVRAADAYREMIRQSGHDHQGECLMCSVRALNQD